MKRLYIVRHGAAQSSYESGGDFARRLTPDGARRVRNTAQWLQKQPDRVVPQRIIASLAPRAAETAAIIADTFGLPVSALSKVRELYSGTPNDYLKVLAASLPDSVSCAMIVGHNPAVSELLATVTGAMAGDYRMRKSDLACVVFDLPGDAPWEELYAAEGRLERYVIAASVPGQESVQE